MPRLARRLGQAPKPRQVVRRTVTLFDSFDSVTLFDGSTVAVSVPALQGQLNATDWPADARDRVGADAADEDDRRAGAAAPSFLIVIPLLRSELTSRSGRSAAIVHEREALPV